MEKEMINNCQNQEINASVINKTGSIVANTGEFVIQCITIVGQIEGHYILADDTKTTKYEHILPQLVAVEQDPLIDGMIILLNTVGGDVEAGLAIAELIAGMKKPTVSMVLGGGHSIGVPLAVCAKRSFIAKSASMTIHPVRMTGVMLGVPQTFEYFNRMQKRINRFVCDNSKISLERFTELSMNTKELVMDVGTVLDGIDAVKEGLIDELGTLSDALNCLYNMIEFNKNKK
ncbi:MAG: ATP-dependent Clp protease proteolytic subunit [Clostridia bacterium]|nr:ATP-dependent Clp protease proteolytic subunit [Clostridia bacterium]